MKKLINAILFYVLFTHLVFGQNKAVLENEKFSFLENILTVSTGKIQRQWKWTGNGFLTTSFINQGSGKEWATSITEHTADWDLPTKIGEGSTAKLISVNCMVSDDEKFTSPHLLITAYMKYSCDLEVHSSISDNFFYLQFKT